MSLALDSENPHWKRFWVQADFIPDVELLPLRMDFDGIRDSTPDQILKPSVAVKSTAVLPRLHKPRPVAIRRSCNEHSMVDDEARVGDALVARQIGVHFVRRRRNWNHDETVCAASS